MLVAVLTWSATARAQQNAEDAAHIAWMKEPTAEAAEAALASYLAQLRAEQRGPYLGAVGQKLRGSLPALQGAAGRRCVMSHMPLLAALPTADADLVDWFAIKAAEFLAIDNDDAEGAVAVLDDSQKLLAQPTSFKHLRTEIDCRISLQQLVVAERRCAELAAAARTPLDRVQVLSRRGTIDVMLGRLDQAGRSLDDADRLLAELEPDERGVSYEQVLLLQRRLDLLTANEQYAAVRPTIERRGATLDALPLRVHMAAADYHATQHEPATVATTIATLEALRSQPDLELRNKATITVWLADLELRCGHLDRATRLLADIKTVSPRNRWLAAPIAAEVARRSGADRTTLLQHEAELRAILGEMVAEWREVAWERESTGFLRLGSRLRVLAELIAITTALYGPERAMDDVLTVQCCTTASRARGAEPLPLAELRARLLDDDHGALVFVPAWNESHVFAFDRSRFVHEVLPRASELRRQVGNVRTELLALDGAAVPATLDALRRAARTLADSLLPATVRQEMQRWRHLTITGGNLLGNPAFACLPWDGDTLLGERFAMATNASLPLLVRMQAEADAPVASEALSARLFATLSPSVAFASRNGLGAAAVMSGPSWERLLQQLPPGAPTFVDAAATAAAYDASSHAGTHRFTLLLAHGEQATDGEPATLGLTPDPRHEEGTLSSTTIRGTPERGLVMIAACYAARGPVRMGDDDVADSLAGAFLFAGAHGIVASAAPLRASMYMDAGAGLLEALAGGATQAEALRRGRLQAGGDDVAQRYRAAQIDMVGLGTMVLVQPPGGSAWWLWPLGVVLVGALIRVWFRKRLSGRCTPSG